MKPPPTVEDESRGACAGDVRDRVGIFNDRGKDAAMGDFGDNGVSEDVGDCKSAAIAVSMPSSTEVCSAGG